MKKLLTLLIISFILLAGCSTTNNVNSEVPPADISPSDSSDAPLYSAPTLQATPPPLCTKVSSAFSEVVTGALPANIATGNGLNNSGNSQEDYAIFEDYGIVTDYVYGPSDLFTAKIVVVDGVVSGISSSTDYLNGNLFSEPDMLADCAKIALAPALLVFKGGDYPALLDALWANMELESFQTRTDYQKTEHTTAQYKFSCDGVEVALTVIHRNRHSNSDGVNFNYSLIDSKITIPQSLINAVKSQPDYIAAKKSYKDATKGHYKNWAIATDDEKYYTTMNLLKTLLEKDGLFNEVGVFPLTGTNGYNAIYARFLPVQVIIQDLPLNTKEGDISFYMTAVKSDLAYRIYKGDVNNEVFEYWVFDWDGNQLESSTTLSMSEYVSALVPIIEEEKAAEKAEAEKTMLDEAGVLPEFRFESASPEVTVTGYMKNGTQFLLDNKIALKGHWETDRWDVIEELFVAPKYRLEHGKRYTLKGVLDYDALQQIEILEVSE